MMNKQFLAALTAITLTIGLLYFHNGLNTDPHTSDYEFLAVSDHEKLESGRFPIQMNSNGPTEKIALGTAYRSSIVTTNAVRNIFAPAINAAAIAKFLNGNLPTTTPTTNAPNLLSQTGAFANLGTLTPNQGLIPYDMIEPFWSDGATKRRWMAIPNDGSHNTPEEQIQFSLNDAWDFPRGAVLIKHFELGGKRLETRFEVKGDDDVYYYLTYKWNDAQTDATLLDEAVYEDVVVNGVTQSWHYPSRNECASCHFPQNGSVLGPKTRNLNKAIVYPSTGVQMNQLVNLSELGILTENITNGNAETYPAVAAKNDLSASLEERARSYIDVNCASCHNPQVDNVAMFDARYSTPLANQNIIYGDVIYDEGLSNPKVIIPQDVSNSMMHFRMNSTQTGIEMPPLAKDVVDTKGVQLIADWINSLTPAATSPPVAIISASTVNGPAPLSVTFDASASTDPDDDPLTYSWDFGDGTTGQGSTIDHVYNAEGSYTASLTVSDSQYSDETTTTIVVNNSNPGGNSVAFTDATSLIQQNNYSGLAMAVIDMNGDGKDDIVQFNSAKNLRIQYQNGPGQAFSTYSYGQVSSKNQWSTAVADFDQNGYNDVLCGGAYDNLRVIANNNGNNSFSSQTLPSSNIFIQGSNFVDINNDGWADIFACHDDAESRAYQNNQNGTFSFNASLISTETDPSSDNSGNYASMWIDYDNDGDLDLYISKCRGGVTSSSDPRRINMLWQNDGNNNFTEVAAQANLKIGAQTWLSDFGDIDNDGDLDAIVINHGTGPNLMRNNGNGTFTEVTTGSGLLPTLNPQDFYGIQGFFKDFNNDGYLDLMVSGDNHYIFYNNGDGTFQHASNPFNSNQIQSFTVGDLNHDGFLDLYAGYANGLNSPSSIRDRIWLNQGNSNNFLNIQLKGTQSNINGIGARVELYGAWGIQIRDVKSGEGYGLANTFTQHFGIGVNTQVDKVIVRWPSGVVDEVVNPAVNQFLNIVEGEDVCTTANVTPEYSVNGTTNSGAGEIIINEGDELTLSLVQEEDGLRITLPNGSVVEGEYTIDQITLSDAGSYLFTTNFGCTATLSIVVQDPCPMGSVVPEYTVNGTTNNGDSEITIYEGDALSLGLVSSTGTFTITLPSGTQVQNGYTVSSVTQTNEGIYTFTTTAACTATLNIIIQDPCPAGSVVPEYTINGTTNNGDSEITIDEGDELSLTLASNTVAFSITLPDGSQVQNGYTVSSVTQTNEGAYIFTTELGCTASLNIIVNEPSCPPAGTSCDDGDSSTTDDVEDGNCNCAGTPISSGTEFCTGISTSWDDAEENVSNGNMRMVSSDLELVSDGGEQLVGLRFNNIAVPRGAVIESAHIQFTTDETGTGTTGLTIRAEASDDAPGLNSGTGNLSSRNLTGASVGWNPSAWNTQGEAGAAQKTPDLKAVVQEVVNRSGYVQGNSLAFIISGSGRRTAESYDGSVQGAPRLCIVYNTDGSCPAAGTPCDDGNPDTVDDTEDGNCNCTGTPVASGEVCSRVSTSSDDAEERTADGNVDMNSSDLELVSDGGEQLVGIRFNGIDIPQGAVIESAHIQFTVDESDTGTADLTIRAEASDNAVGFSLNTNDISARNLTGASVGWSPSAWNTPGESGAAQRTPDLRTVVQEIVDRPSFSAGNSLVFIVSGSGTRTAESYDGSPQSAPELCIVYNTDGSCPAAGTPCDDGNVNTIDDVEDGNCNCAGTPVTSGEVCSGISTSRDDVEEHVSTGDMNMGSSDLELVTDNGFIGGQQIVGLRFNGIDIPQGAVIDRAHIQFTTDEVGTGSGSLSIRAEATDNAVAFSSGTGNLSARDLTGASVDWGPPPWNTQGESGAAQKTPDLREVVQEIVDRPGFASGSSMVFIITGSGTRTAESYDGSPQNAPQLCITYSGSDNGISLSARIDQDIAADPPIQDNDVVLYPNPTAGTLYLDLMNYEETALYCTVFNASQQVVHETYFDEAHMRIERLDLDNLSDGMYTISIRSERGHVSKIILVKK